MLAQQVVELIILHLILQSAVHIYDFHIFKNFIIISIIIIIIIINILIIIIIIIIILSRVYNVY